MTRSATMVLALAILASPEVAEVGAQSPAPAWLEDRSGPGAKIETRHLIAETEAVDLARATGGRVTLRLRITPRPGMRIYAHDVTGYVPLSVRVDALAGLTVRPATYPASTPYVFPPTGETSRVHEAVVTVEQAAVLSDALRRSWLADDRTTLSATLRYQACDDTLCYRPESVRVAWQVAR